MSSHLDQMILAVQGEQIAAGNYAPMDIVDTIISRIGPEGYEQALRTIISQRIAISLTK